MRLTHKHYAVGAFAVFAVVCLVETGAWPSPVFFAFLAAAVVPKR